MFQTGGVREQFNSLTAFVDASMVYDPNPELAEALYDQDTGLMLTTELDSGVTLLPRINTAIVDGVNRTVFTAGDPRCDLEKQS